MSLGVEQRKFTLMVSKLITFAYDQGYELTFGDAYRDPRVFGAIGESAGYGKASSNHKNRLAVDLNLFKDGKYLSKTADHIFLGKYWEAIGGSWGGRFNDGNHYSLEYKGMR